MRYMKKALNILITAFVLTACNNRSNLETDKNMLMSDTSKMYNSSILTDTGSVIQATSLNNDQNFVPAANRTPVYTNRNSNSVRRHTASTRYARRRGWSHAAKDATIGGVGGAITGALISRHHGSGALIGGLLGAGGGYLIGHGKDKREGR